jgi:DNA-directed RNA polymerase specialized sigma24 family protein
VAFSLRFFEEMTLEEIAEAMQVEVGTAKAHLFRAVNAVRNKLKEQKRT